MIVKLETTLYRYLEDEKFVSLRGLKYKMFNAQGIVPISHIVRMKKDWFKYHKALQLLSEAANVPGEIIVIPSPLFRFVRLTPKERWSEMNVFTHWDIEPTSKNKVISICSTRYYSENLTEEGREEVDNICCISSPESLTTIIGGNFDPYEGDS
jgi:hypothetical protein